MVAQQPRPIIATARKVKLGGATTATTKLKESGKETRAWDVYDRLGEVHYPIRKRGDIASKIRYFLAETQDGEDEPQPVTTGPALDAFETAVGSDVMRRLVSELVVHWDVVGRAYLVGTEDGEETGWDVYSTQELIKAGDKYAKTTQSGEQSVTLDADRVWQVWRPHPRHSLMPDAPLFSALDVAEELIELGNSVRARSRSRIPAGLFVIPDSLTVATDPNDPDDPPAFDEVLMRRMMAPIGDTKDAGSLVPLVATVPAEDIQYLKDSFISFQRDWADERDERDNLIRRIAIGLDLPPELLLGMGDVNHWQAWWVGDSAVHHHVDPTVQSVLESLSVPWLRPILEAAGVSDPARFVIWRDLSTAIIPTRRDEVTFRAHERLLISDDAARHNLGYSELDAPVIDPGAVMGSERAREVAEIIQKIYLGVDVVVTAEEAREIVRAAIEGSDIPELPDVPDKPLEGKLPDQRGPARAALLAQIEPVEELSLDQLAEIDAGILLWTVDEAQRQLDRILTILTDGIDTPIDELLAGFAARLETRIRRAQEATRAAVDRLVGLNDDELTDDEHTRNRDTALALILAAVTTAIVTARHTPDALPDPADIGEVLDRRIPVQELRHGLSIAGGGPASLDGAVPTELIGNGQTATVTLETHGYRTGAIRWQYGDPAARERNFPPHQALDGITVGSFEGLPVDENDSWLGRTNYRPGDHKGCLCRYVRIVQIRRQAA